MYYEIIGYLAGLFMAVSFIPQAWKTVRSKEVDGLSLGMYLLFNISMICWIIYGFYLKSYQMLIFNSICLCFSLPVLVMILKYKKKTA